MDTTPLSSTKALYALSRRVPDIKTLGPLLEQFSCWGDLTTAPAAELAWYFRDYKSVPTFEEACPDLPEFSPLTRVLDYYDEDYHPNLRTLPRPPAVIFQRGRTPSGFVLGIAGSYYPSDTGIMAARAAVEEAAELDLVVATVLGTGIGDTVIRECLKIGVSLIAVSPSFIDLDAADSGLIEEIAQNREAIFSVAGPGSLYQEAAKSDALTVCAAMSDLVFIPELGVHQQGGVQFASAAMELDRFMVVPVQPQEEELLHGAIGTAALSRAQSFDPMFFSAVSQRVKSRVQLGQSPADAVVSNQRELRDAFQAGVSRVAAMY